MVNEEFGNGAPSLYMCVFGFDWNALIGSAYALGWWVAEDGDSIQVVL
jgi:hypothetical protein